MAQDPSQFIRGAFAAFNESGADGFLDYLVERDALHRDFMMEIRRDAPNGGQWRGPEGFRDMARRWMEVWDEFQVLPDDVIETAPDSFVVPVRQRAVTQGGGLELDEEFVYTVELSDGRMRRMGLFGDRDEADRFLAGGSA